MLSMEHNMPFKDDLKGFCSELTIPSYNFDHSDTSSVLNKWEDINTLSALYYGIFRSSYKKWYVEILKLYSKDDKFETVYL